LLRPNRTSDGPATHRLELRFRKADGLDRYENLFIASQSRQSRIFDGVSAHSLSTTSHERGHIFRVQPDRCLNQGSVPRRLNKFGCLAGWIRLARSHSRKGATARVPVPMRDGVRLPLAVRRRPIGRVRCRWYRVRQIRLRNTCSHVHHGNTPPCENRTL
jgi:hypothetical protein